MVIESTRKETQLVFDLKRQHRPAQELFYKTYYGQMFPIALRYSFNREDAQEILNTAFLKVIKNIQAYQNDNFGGWVSTIVRRTAIDHCRKFKYDKPSSVEVLEIDAKTYNDALSNLGVEDIVKLMHQLPDSTRLVFNLFVFEELSHKEIAKQLSIAEGTSKWHVANARTLLVSLIQNNNL